MLTALQLNIFNISVDFSIKPKISLTLKSFIAFINPIVFLQREAISFPVFLIISTKLLKDAKISVIYLLAESISLQAKAIIIPIFSINLSYKLSFLSTKFSLINSANFFSIGIKLFLKEILGQYQLLHL